MASSDITDALRFALQILHVKQALQEKEGIQVDQIRYAVCTRWSRIIISIIVLCLSTTRSTSLTPSCVMLVSVFKQTDLQWQAAVSRALCALILWTRDLHLVATRMY